MGSIAYRTDASVLVLLLALGMVAAMWAGLRYAARRPGGAGKVDAAIETASFALLGLLFAFTFGMAGERHSRQRGLLVDEANAIAAGILRSDMYPEPERSGFREEFRAYLEARIADYDAGFDQAKILDARASSASTQRALWSRATRLSQDPARLAASNQMIPALTDILRLTAARQAAERGRTPDVILGLLFCMCVVASFIAAYLAAHANRFDWVAAASFVVLASLVGYVILELDRPRRGFIGMQSAMQTMRDVRSLF